MKVKELIEALKEQDQDAEISIITIGSNNEWERTSEPEITSHKNMFGHWVFVE